MKIGWNWGDFATAPYKTERISDYPDQNVKIVDGEKRIGPFRVGNHQCDQFEKTSEQVKQVILNTRIIQDNSHRFACPPLVMRGARVEREKKK